MRTHWPMEAIGCRLWTRRQPASVVPHQWKCPGKWSISRDIPTRTYVVFRKERWGVGIRPWGPSWQLHLRGHRCRNVMILVIITETFKCWGVGSSQFQRYGMWNIARRIGNNRTHPICACTGHRGKPLSVSLNGAGISPDQKATPQEMHMSHSTIRNMLFIGRISNPVMLYHARSMPSKVGSLEALHLADLGALLRLDNKVTPTMHYVSQPAALSSHTKSGLMNQCLQSRNEAREAP